MKIIHLKTFTIINENGLSLISLQVDDSLDPSYISGFLSAIYSFGTKSLNEQMSKMSIESDNLRVDSLVMEFQGHNYIALGLISKKVPKTHFKLFAERILQEFYEEHVEVLKNFDGNLSMFDSFKDKVEKEIAKYFSDSEELFEDKMDKIFQDILKGDLSSLNKLMKNDD